MKKRKLVHRILHLLIAVVFIVAFLNACNEEDSTQLDISSQDALLTRVAEHFNMEASDVNYFTYNNVKRIKVGTDMIFEIDQIKTEMENANDPTKQQAEDCLRGNVIKPFPHGRTVQMWRAQGKDYTHVVHYIIDPTLPSLWRDAARNSFDRWNNISTNRMRFEEAPCGAILNFYGIYVTKYQETQTSIAAIATVGATYLQKFIWVNQLGNSYGSNDIDYYERVLTHEIGHNLGFRHTNSTAGCTVAGTNSSDSQSIMWDVVQPNSVPIFTTDDILAYQTLYDHVNVPVEFCLGFNQGCPGNTGSCP
jgi:predicted Zn-dependent protease with MMP-like domain